MEVDKAPIDNRRLVGVREEPREVISATAVLGRRKMRGDREEEGGRGIEEWRRREGGGEEDKYFEEWKRRRSRGRR